MPGIAELALGAAPIAGGALLGIAVGGMKGPDVRGMIAKDMDLLERIPPDHTELRERLERSIDQRIEDLIATTERSRELRTAAMSTRATGVLRGQLARHRGVPLYRAVHDRVVEREPQPHQLAGDVSSRSSCCRSSQGSTRREAFCVRWAECGATATPPPNSATSRRTVPAARSSAAVRPPRRRGRCRARRNRDRPGRSPRCAGLRPR